MSWSYCAPNTRYEWVCFNCQASIEYGYTDQYLYCDCGRSLYSNYDFKCKEEQHGSAFERHNQEKLLQLLDALEPYEELNILILGETGAGKSTFINAFINYLTFDTLDEPMKAEKLHWVIPCSFSLQYMDKSSPDNNWVEKHFEISHGSGWNDGTAGYPVAQKPNVYAIALGTTIFSLIDTPGFGDTRGVEQDWQNMSEILSTLRHFEKLHGILILLKNQNSRLTLMFRYCVKELLARLHRNAATNIAFGFTSTRISNYTPGDTFKPLKVLLDEYKNVGIGLRKSNVFCFDSESFRFLAAYKSGVRLGNIEDFRRSWQHSADEAKRLLRHFRSLTPHCVKSTMSLNRSRKLVILLMKLMADITQSIAINIQNNEDNLRELAKEKCKGDQLRKHLHLQKVVLGTRSLDKPRMVCTHGTCVKYQNDENGQCRVIYKTVCREPCYMEEVEGDTITNPQFKSCAVFLGGEQCSTCGHNWMLHMHVLYELYEHSVTVMDSSVEEQLKKHATDTTLKQVAIDGRKKMIDQALYERREIQNAAAY